MEQGPRPGGEPPGLFSTELANSVTHGVGLGLSIAGLAILVAFASLRGEAVHILACSVYGATLVFLYLASTLYHGVHAPRAKKVLQIIDHSAIYLLIAGTYTPLALISLRGAWGWTVFAVVWGIATAGVAFKIVFGDRFPVTTVLLYLGMGWLGVVIMEPLLDQIGTAGVVWLVIGGLAYTFGLIFFCWESLPHHHAIWHLFVMAGSTCHFFAVMLHVLPLDVRA